MSQLSPEKSGRSSLSSIHDAIDYVIFAEGSTQNEGAALLIDIELADRIEGTEACFAVSSKDLRELALSLLIAANELDENS